MTTRQIDFGPPAFEPGAAARGRKRAARWSVAFVVISSLAAACGGTTPFATAVPTTRPVSTATPPARRSLPAGYAPFVDAADHFSIAVPDTWRRIDLSTPGASQALRDLVESNPRLKRVLGSNAAALIAQGIKFYAVNANAGADVPAINVGVRPAVGIRETDLPQIGNALRSQYATIGATISTITTSSVAGHQALEVAVTFRGVGPTGAATTKQEIQDFIAANDYLYILTLAGTSPEFRTIAATLDLS